MAQALRLGMLMIVSLLLPACVHAEQPTTDGKRLGPGDHSLTLKVGELERRYVVHVPKVYDGKMPVPIVIMLHGGGGSGPSAARETGWSDKADKEGFLAVFPDAQPPDPTKPPHFRNNPPLWNDGSERLYPGQKPADDVAFLNALLDDLIVRFTVDQKRVFVTGFSNGAGMSYWFAAAAPTRVAAIAPASGTCWVQEPKLARPIPACYISGTADPLNPIDGGVPKLANGTFDKVRAKPRPPVREQIAKWAKANGCPEKPKSVTDANGVRTEVYGPGRDGAEVIYITVEDMGHTWAGGMSILPESLVGKTSDKLKACDVVWDFFVNHPIPAEDAEKARITKESLGPGDHSMTLKVGELERRYIVHVPKGYDGKKPVPVVVMFHGGGGTARAAMKETGWTDKADQTGFLAVFPEGSPPDPSKPGNFRTNPQTWNDGSGRFHAGEKNIDDAAFTRALLDDLSARFKVDPRRVYLTGFSNGSSLTYRLGVELSDRIAAIAPVASSGLRLKDPIALKCPVPMITIQGTADPRNPIEGGDVKNFDFIDRRPPIKVSVERWAKLLDCPAEPKVVRDEGGVKVLRYGPGKEGAVIDFYIIEGMGHTWPGGISLLPESLVGKTTDKLKANDVIWEFFQQHSLGKVDEKQPGR